MKERPILFSAPMVRALLDGSKTQTRRVVKPQPELETYRWDASASDAGLWMGTGLSLVTGGTRQTWGWSPCPYGQPGDRLWVRESWNSNGLNWGKPIREMHKGLGPIHYAASDQGEWKPYWGPWKPSIHMPRWASRITLEITGVRVERLNDCSDADALAEGVDRTNTSISGYAQERYRRLWESINGAGSWDANPWVWVIEFRRLTA